MVFIILMAVETLHALISVDPVIKLQGLFDAFGPKAQNGHRQRDESDEPPPKA
jgi:hypothetical protein